MKNYIKYIILFSILFSTEIVVAQLFVASNANITITPDASFCIKGNASNNGLIQNSGAIFLNGDWENSGIYNPTGTMVLNGKNQQINHNAAFYNLTIDSGGNKTFLSNTSITNMLLLENGFVIPNANTHFLIDNLGRTSAGSDISYVNGTLYNSGTGNKYFPIGNSQGFYPAELLSVTGSSPIIGFSVKPNTSIVMGSDLSRITSVMNTHYWQKEILAGDYEGGYLALPIMTDDYLYDSLLVEVMQATQLESNFVDIGNNISAESLKTAQNITMPVLFGLLTKRFILLIYVT
ncbi:MAG: hypothetical protein IPO21_17945 [Bacteroidales bacterium]|nr:hypothetical protein [Bacteroidales bacterium]